MENKINIAELLKDCPKGMELDCTIFDNVTFVGIDNNRKRFPIEIKVGGLHSRYLTKEGCFNDNTIIPESKCAIFPKGKTTWEGFKRPFKDGDVVINDRGNIFIYKGLMYYDKNRVDFYCGYLTHEHKFVIKESKDSHFGSIDSLRLATEEEKKNLFKSIKEHDYCWNAETKTLEKLVAPKFKVGDVVQLVGKQDCWELISNKFNITTLKPFDKVLVRDENDQKWMCDIFSYYDNKNVKYPFWGVGRSNSKQCIPYKGNEHLLGTTNDCDDCYKNW